MKVLTFSLLFVIFIIYVWLGLRLLDVMAGTVTGATEVERRLNLCLSFTNESCLYEIDNYLELLKNTTNREDIIQ